MNFVFSCIWWLAAACLLLAANVLPLHTAEPSHNGNVGFYAVGGGFLSAGLNGTYYADPNMQNAVFERRDIRIDFDWGEVIKPGGSLAYTKLGSIPTDNYSVRWEGQLIPRFSEVYTVVAEADSTRIWIKPSAQTDWQDPLITHWPTSEGSAYQPHKAVFTFEAGQKYDIRIDYRERTGPARMRLLWSSPSTPLEVIQSTAMVGTKPPQKGIILANAAKAANSWAENYQHGAEVPDGKKNKTIDIAEDGWPAEDFTFVLRPIDRDVYHGSYLFVYKGSSSLRIHLNAAEIFSEDGATSYGESKIPKMATIRRPIRRVF